MPTFASVVQRDTGYRDAISDRYLSMTRQALAQGATFILWPESATPLPFEQDIVGASAIRRLAVESNATFLIGSDQIEPILVATPADKAQPRYYNAAFLVKPDGTVGGVVFAEARTDDEVGYALTPTSVRGAIAPALGRTGGVSTGECIH